MATFTLALIGWGLLVGTAGLPQVLGDGWKDVLGFVVVGVNSLVSWGVGLFSEGRSVGWNSYSLGV